MAILLDEAPLSPRIDSIKHIEKINNDQFAHKDLFISGYPKQESYFPERSTISDLSQ